MGSYAQLRHPLAGMAAAVWRHVLADNGSSTGDVTGTIASGETHVYAGIPLISFGTLNTCQTTEEVYKLLGCWLI